MELTSRHINEKQFHDQWRGYNQEEVDDFLDRVAEALDELERENRDLRSRLRELDQLVETSRSTEEMLKKTLMTAQQAAEEAIAAAKTKAEQLIGQAEVRAERANEELKLRVQTAEDEVRRRTIEAEREQLAKQKELVDSIERLKAHELDLRRRLRTFFEQQLKVIDSFGAAKPAAQEAKPAVEQPQTQRVDTPAPQANQSAPEPVVIADAAVGDEEAGPDDGFDEFSPVEDGARRRVRRGLFRREAREEEEWSQQA